MHNYLNECPFYHSYKKRKNFRFLWLWFYPQIINTTIKNGEWKHQNLIEKEVKAYQCKWSVKIRTSSKCELRKKLMMHNNPVKTAFVVGIYGKMKDIYDKRWKWYMFGNVLGMFQRTNISHKRTNWRQTTDLYRTYQPTWIL